MTNESVDDFGAQKAMVEQDGPPKNCKEIACLPYAQPGAMFYASTIPAREIVHRLEIRRRSVDPERGMQRDDNPARVREISNYALEDNAVFPTPIIVSANSEVVQTWNGRLYLPNNEAVVGHVLDGQHRLLGLKNLTSDRLEQFELLIVFVFDIDVYSEATIFSTINSTQKQVSKSLMYDLFALNPGRSVEKTCHEIVRSLNDDIDSPFYKRIKILGKKVGDYETLSQSAFVDQIARQIKDKNGPLYGYFHSDSDWVIRKIIANCYRAILRAQRGLSRQDSYPEDYFLKTTGFGGVAQALKELVMVGIEKQDVTEEFFYGVMVDYFKEYPTPPSGTGNSAMLVIKKSLLKVAGVSNEEDKT